MDTRLHTARHTATAPVPTARERVYRDVRRRLLLGEFAGHTRLGEERLAASLEVSRTPVREALVMLAADGLLERRDDGGYYPRRPDVAALRDLYELRITLETRAVLRAKETTEPHDPAILEPLRDAWRSLGDDPPPPDPSFVELDESFHVELCRASGNAALTETLAAVNARIRPVRIYDFLTEGRIAATIRQHLHIAETLLAGSVGSAATLLQRHVGESLDVVERRAARAVMQMALRGGGVL